MNQKEYHYCKSGLSEDKPKDWHVENDRWHEDVKLIIQADIARQLTKISDSLAELEKLAKGIVREDVIHIAGKVEHG